jgi:hypothetical protein
METKIRIFLIDDKDKAEMEEDLANEELMEFYWWNTG